MSDPSHFSRKTHILRDFTISRYVRMATVLALALIVLAVTAYSTWRIVVQNLNNELLGWESRLGIIADSRVEQIESWINERFHTLETISQESSIGLYVSNLMDAGDDNQHVVSIAQRRYLENFLIVSARQGTFLSPNAGPAIGANLPKSDAFGLMIVTPQGRLVAATPNSPTLDDAWITYLSNAGDKKRNLRTMFFGSPKKLLLGFVVPMAFSKNGGEPLTLAYVIGIRPASRAFFTLLKQPGSIFESLEAYLVRLQSEHGEYLSPLRQTDLSIGSVFDSKKSRVAAAQAIQYPGRFLSAHNYAGRAVLATGRQIFGGVWTLVQTVDRAEALGESEARKKRDLAIAALCLLLLAGGAVVIWRYSISSRLQAALDQNRIFGARLLAKERLLRGITDTVADEIFIVDDNGSVQFGNLAFSSHIQLASENFLNKRLSSLLGPAEAAHYLEIVKKVQESGNAVTVEQQDLINSLSVLRISVTPFRYNSSKEISYLVVVTDVTDVIVERARREKLLDDLLDSLVAMVDQRDPAARQQSQEAIDLATAIAKEMSISAEKLGIVKMTARLANFYKMLVPVSVLTQNSPLGPDARSVIEHAQKEVITFLAAISELTPVCRALAQLNENFDGSGRPHGLKGNEICLVAQIVTLANSFVAMTKGRSYRDRLTVDNAISEVKLLSGSRFSPPATAAFLNYMENREGRSVWAT